ncbi:MAG: hypothetical protein PHU14_08005 [Methylovulum sp.]|nr:hypothetical protein [Methylovulum sp.]
MNREKPHVLILPEDDANRNIVNGFLEHFSIDFDAIHVLKPAGGWKIAADMFGDTVAARLRTYPLGIAILLIDFDEKDGNLTNVGYARKRIPKDLQSGMFILGVYSQPEDLKSDLKRSFRLIGEQLAKDCYDNTNTLWQHPLLSHNQAELQRMVANKIIELGMTARQIIFAQ